jgi:peptide/nickel transport system permease protein
MKFVFLGSDLLLFLTLLLAGIILWRSLKKPLTRRAFEKLKKDKTVIITGSILLLYLSTAVLDSIHFRQAIPNSSDTATKSTQYKAKVESVLDVMFGERSQATEKTYSSPFALHSYLKEVKAEGGQYFPKLKGIAAHIKNKSDRQTDVVLQLIYALLISAITAGVLRFLFGEKRFFSIVVWSSLVFVLIVMVLLERHYHILGTDKIGQDVFYQTIKSIRTGLVIGLITTLVTLPFAIILGLAAGYFGGRLDDLIQYIYITISSIPGVLLIAASVLSMQVFISNHPEMFQSLMARSDARLIALCIILGLTGWTSLCRVLRAETLKLREIDYIQAAKVLGSRSSVILFKHILPNVMHLILIAVVLDFSFLVLAEAVLSYIGVGVSPLTISWGNMINGARLELAREPVVWWPMLAAFIFMFMFVLSTNLLADKVRDVFDPRAN